jgi:glycosyltransferase involved in cell wall biosynthesis
MRLSVIIPVYNELSTLALLLLSVARALPAVEKEIVIVDDGSSDGSREWLDATFPGGEWTGAPGADDGAHSFTPGPAIEGKPAMTVRTINHDRNRGKGASVRTGLAAATGDVFVIQDADLEYDPQDWQMMYELIAIRKVADVVYGSRFFGKPHRSLYFHHYVANRLISILFNALYNQTLSDIEVCYKMFTRAVRESIDLSCDDFGVEIQFSAQVALARHWRIYETGIAYYGRTYNEGKKINWKDGLKALWYILKFRVAR